MKKAFSVKNVLSKNFNVLEFDGKWLDAIGNPEHTGTWVVYGPPKNGKTSFCFQLSKYLTRFGKVLYNSVEEGVSQSIKQAVERENMLDVSGKFVIERYDVEELKEVLNKRRSPQIVVIDSIQFAELSFRQYKELKNLYKNKLIIYVSHVEGKVPDGLTAKKIWRDANVSIYIEGFSAFPQSRYGGGEPLIINEELAEKYR